MGSEGYSRRFLQADNQGKMPKKFQSTLLDPVFSLGSAIADVAISLSLLSPACRVPGVPGW